MNWLKSLLFSKKRTSKRTSQSLASRLRVRPSLETLEERMVPTVNYHLGPVLDHVHVQAMYLGSDWATKPTYQNQVGYLEGYLKYIVNSPYMDMLTNAGYQSAYGYQVGRGSFVPGWVDGIGMGSSISQDAIVSKLRSALDHGKLAAPNSNSLYVVFVQDNVLVTTPDGQTSANNFLAFHSSFQYTDTSTWSQYDVPFAVVAYPGGTSPVSVGGLPAGVHLQLNYSVPWLPGVNQLTEATSHELAEAVTDPLCDFFGEAGWYDNAKGVEHGEVGDLANLQTVYLHGYAVQRIADQNDQAMTPAGATAYQPVSFVLKPNGTLWEYSPSPSFIGKAAGLRVATELATGILSISYQGIDNYGYAFVDAVTNTGVVLECHDIAAASVYGTKPSNYWACYGTVVQPGNLNQFGNGIQSARAGQGVSYVLLTNGNVEEYRDADNSWRQIATGATAIDAGTDREGVNCVDVLYPATSTSHLVRIGFFSIYVTIQIPSHATEFSDSSGAHSIASNVQQISAGQQGNAYYVDNSGNAYRFNELTGNRWLGFSNVKQIAAGTDATGFSTANLLFNNGDVFSLSTWNTLGHNVQSFSKDRNGLLDLLFSGGNVDEVYDSAWSPSWTNYLTSNAVAVG
jgi:hypothetical protein